MKFKILGAIAGLTLPLISQTLPTAQARELSPSTTQASALLQPTLKAPLALAQVVVQVSPRSQLA